ncbi:MAG: GNAT family N-acetyltransferase [Bacteroidota bacterium]|nr:GNAT family N-acetyltransferase [Bacteroidota bacterium]
MKIRKAEINDLNGIMSMYQSCVGGMIKNGIDQWDSTYPNASVILKDIKEKTYYVIEEGGIIGGINIDKNQDPTYLNIKWYDKKNQFLVVHRLAVKEEYWREGIGKRLMLFTEKLVIKNKLNSIRLDTYSGNPYAIVFYKKLGYKELGSINLKPNKNEYYCFEKIIR